MQFKHVPRKLTQNMCLSKLWRLQAVLRNDSLPLKKGVMLCQSELIRGAHIERNYIFYRQGRLDFLWVSKNKNEMEKREVGLWAKLNYA